MIVLGILLGLASPLPAAGAVPVRIEKCRLDYIPANMHGFSLSENVGPLHITFANVTSKPVTRVQFRIDVNGNSVYIGDTGNFGPNVDIAHVYRQMNGTHRTGTPEPQPKCSVAAVTFADGSIWQAP